MTRTRKRRIVTACQRHLGNPLLSRVPGQTVLETTGRRSGLPRRTPVGGRRRGDHFWMVSEFGLGSHYVRNILADPRVRLRLRGSWYCGVAHLLPDDDARARLHSLPRLNSIAVRALGTNLLTIRVDLEGTAGARTAQPQLAVKNSMGGISTNRSVTSPTNPSASVRPLTRSRRRAGAPDERSNPSMRTHTMFGWCLDSKT